MPVLTLTSYMNLSNKLWFLHTHKKVTEICPYKLATVLKKCFLNVTIINSAASTPVCITFTYPKDLALYLKNSPT